MSNPAQAHNFVQVSKHVGDAAMTSTLVASLAGLIPTLASAATFIWFCIRIWETDTVQGWKKTIQGWHKKKKKKGE